MNSSQLERAFKLVKKTGDKAIVFEKDSDDAVVLMNLEGYENLLEAGNRSDITDLTEEELMEKINKDVAVWRAFNEKNHAEMEIYSRPPDVKREEFAMPAERPSAQNFAAPEEEVLKNIPRETQETTEEKFYLEPIE